MREPECIQRLRDRGLRAVYRDYEEDWLDNNQQLTPPKPGDVYDTCRIIKPASVGGNVRLDYHFPITFGDEKIVMDAPPSALRCFFPDTRVWHFVVREGIGTRVAGDFDRTFPSLEAAVDAALDYYFGSPNQMNSPEVMKAINFWRKQDERNRMLEKFYNRQEIKVEISSTLYPFVRAANKAWNLCQSLVHLRYWHLYLRGWRCFPGITVNLHENRKYISLVRYVKKTSAEMAEKTNDD